MFLDNSFHLNAHKLQPPTGADPGIFDRGMGDGGGGGGPNLTQYVETVSQLTMSTPRHLSFILRHIP